MRPVCITLIPGKNYVLGSFGDEHTTTWWKSLPFENCKEIIDTEWIAGLYHIAIVKCTDNTWWLYRSKNYGKSFTPLWQAPSEITLLKQLDFGSFIICTKSHGWYRSNNTGGVITHTSSEAPGCKNLIYLGWNYLVAHRGDAVYISDNLGEDWTKTLDCINPVVHSGHTDISYLHGPSSNLFPALAGVYGRVIAGAGPYLFISDEVGAQWNAPYWEVGERKDPFFEWMKSPSLMSSRFTEIIHTGSDGRLGDNHHFLAVILNGGLGTPMMQVVHFWDIYYMIRSASASMPYALNAGKMLSAYEVQLPGSPNSQSLVCLTYIQKGTNVKPKISLSYDRGLTFDEINLANVKVTQYDETKERDIENDIDSQYYLKLSGYGQPCHNSWKWAIGENYSVRNISYDSDLQLFRKNTKSLSIDTILKRINTKTYTIDELIEYVRNHNYAEDVLIKRIANKPYTPSMILKDTFEKSVNLNIIPSLKSRDHFYLQGLFQKVIDANLYTTLYMKGALDDEFELTMILVNDKLDVVNAIIESVLPQQIDISSTGIRRPAMDSRKHKIFTD